jgi:hypothetical protein
VAVGWVVVFVLAFLFMTTTVSRILQEEGSGARLAPATSDSSHAGLL